MLAVFRQGPPARRRDTVGLTVLSKDSFLITSNEQSGVGTAASRNPRTRVVDVRRELKTSWCLTNCFDNPVAPLGPNAPASRSSNSGRWSLRNPPGWFTLQLGGYHN